MRKFITILNQNDVSKGIIKEMMSNSGVDLEHNTYAFWKDNVECSGGSCKIYTGNLTDYNNARELERTQGWTNTEVVLKRDFYSLGFVLSNEANLQGKTGEIYTSTISGRSEGSETGVLTFKDLYEANKISKEEYESTLGWRIGYQGAGWAEYLGPVVGGASTYVAGKNGLLNQTGSNKKNINDISDLSSEAKNKISTSQRATLNQQERLKPHLTEDDFTGAAKELNGIPLTRADGTLVLRKDGTPYNHMQELSDTYRALEKVQKSYTGILKNPNLDIELKQLYIKNLNKVESDMKRINDLFAPFGGILPAK